MDMPKRGERITIEGPGGAVAVLKRCSGSRDFHLAKVGVTDHSRFGNAEHIRQDIEHFKLCGNLPRGERW